MSLPLEPNLLSDMPLTSKTPSGKSQPESEMVMPLPESDTYSEKQPSESDKRLLEELKTFCRYEPETGKFLLIAHRKYCKKRIGDEIGTYNIGGYKIISSKGKQYYCHRLAFLFMQGFLPLKEVDHINGKRDDNRFQNLRLVTKGEQQRNLRRWKGEGTMAGVTWFPRTARWKARARCPKTGKGIHLGYFLNKEDAEAARKQWEILVDAGYTERHGTSCDTTLPSPTEYLKDMDLSQ